MIQVVRHVYKNSKAREFATEGFGRRLRTLQWSIERVFKTVPPDITEMPTKEIRQEIESSLQVFVANTYGAVDNLAWIWVHERGLADRIPAKHVGLRVKNVSVRATLSPDFLSFLVSLDDRWFPWLVEYRDALAHRIPLYVPPGVPSKDVGQYNSIMLQMHDALSRADVAEHQRLMAEQDRLLVFQPLIAHSTTETSSRYAFHAQMLADFATIEELARRMISELNRAPT